MSKIKALIYKEENCLSDPELFEQLQQAVVELRNNMLASTPISRSGQRVGYGVNKVRRSIAADAIISITKAIKGRPGW
jgi:hypothetical protein